MCRAKVRRGVQFLFVAKSHRYVKRFNTLKRKNSKPELATCKSKCIIIHTGI